VDPNKAHWGTHPVDKGTGERKNGFLTGAQTRSHGRMTGGVKSRSSLSVSSKGRGKVTIRRVEQRKVIRGLERGGKWNRVFQKRYISSRTTEKGKV